MSVRPIVDTLLSQLYHVIYPQDKVSRLTSIDKLLKRTVAADYEQRIPFDVWQTWKTTHLPPRLARVIRRFRKSNPEYTHHLFTDSDCCDFIEDHFSGTEIEKAYSHNNEPFIVTNTFDNRFDDTNMEVLKIPCCSRNISLLNYLIHFRKLLL